MMSAAAVELVNRNAGTRKTRIERAVTWIDRMAAPPKGLACSYAKLASGRSAAQDRIRIKGVRGRSLGGFAESGEARSLRVAAAGPIPTRTSATRSPPWARH